MILDFISPVALFVKVTASMCLWASCSLLPSSSRMYSLASEKVLPEPAEAFIISTPPVLRICSSNLSVSVMTQSLLVLPQSMQ